MKASCIINIKGGIVQNPVVMYKAYAKLKDGRYEVEFDKVNRRSDQQNKYYWKVIVAMVQDRIIELGTEVTKSETHEFLKAKFNFKEIVNEDTGECEQIPLSTTRLNKDGFSGYINAIQRWAAQFLQIVIPDAGEQLKVFNDAD